MSWWEKIYNGSQVGDKFLTPGKGLGGGNRRRPFRIFAKDNSKIVIMSGNAKVPLHKECFDVVEDALTSRRHAWLRVAALHDNWELENSADKLIRQATASSLARGNYVCAVLEHFRIVQYTMVGRWKVIELVQDQVQRPGMNEVR